MSVMAITRALAVVTLPLLVLACGGAGIESTFNATDDPAAQVDQAATGSASSRRPGQFSIVIIPDSQIAVLRDVDRVAAGQQAILESQTRWISANAAAEKIKAVIHVGDVVQYNTAAEWRIAANAMHQLDQVVPYTVLPGNHDMGVIRDPDRPVIRDTVRFNASFPYARQRAVHPGLDVFQDDSRLMEPPHDRIGQLSDNTALRFRAGGAKWLILSLEWNPRPEVVDWADGVVKSHPDRTVILATHAYLYKDGDHHSRRKGHRWAPGGYDGEKLWLRLVKPNPNIRFVVSGHVLGDGAGRRSDLNDGGELVHQMLANYQVHGPLGGAGLMRIITFDSRKHQAQVRTFSPFLTAAQNRQEAGLTNARFTGHQHRFTLHGLTGIFPVDQPTIPALAEDFSRPLSLTELGWRKSSAPFEGRAADPGRWVVTRGQLTQTSNAHSRETGPDRKGTYVVYDGLRGSRWRNYRLGVDVKSADDDGLGLIFYYADPTHYYRLELDRQRRFLRIVRITSGEADVLYQQPHAFALRTWFNLAVEAVDDKIAVFINGRSVIDPRAAGVTLTGGRAHLVDEQLPGRYGSVGLLAWGNAGLAFDNLQLQAR